MPLGDYKWTAGGEGGAVGCPGTVLSAGWYKKGDPTPLVTTYKNPSTGGAYTWGELDTLLGGGTAGTGGTITPTGSGTSAYPAQNISALPTGVSSEGGLTTSTPYSAETVQQMMSAGTFPSGGILWGTEGAPSIEQLLSGQYPQVGTATAPAPVPLPTLGSINVPAPAVTPAPPFEISPQQQAWQDQISGYLSSTLEQGGIGIPEETMALMTQQTTDALKAKETEDIRVMRNNMERRGITNSGFTFSNEQKIRSNTTMAIAKSITDLNIQNAFIKMASFENAMGQAGQFLGYLGEMSQLKYQPEYQTWAAQQQANLYQYQAKIDIYKTQLQQAYAQQNIILTGQINAAMQEDTQAFELQMAEMEIEAANKQAMYSGIGSIVGTTIGGIFGLL